MFITFSEWKVIESKVGMFQKRIINKVPGQIDRVKSDHVQDVSSMTDLVLVDTLQRQIKLLSNRLNCFFCDYI